MATTKDAVLARAAKYESNHVRQGYYVEPDHGEHFCDRCAKKEIATAKADELYHLDPSANHDSFCACCRCGVTLHGWLTDWGASEELACLEDDGFNARRHMDCYLWMLCENSFLQDSEEMRRLLRLLGDVEMEVK